MTDDLHEHHVQYINKATVIVFFIFQEYAKAKHNANTLAVKYYQYYKQIYVILILYLTTILSGKCTLFDILNTELCCTYLKSTNDE